jgi:hypothetical protein
LEFSARWEGLCPIVVHIAEVFPKPGAHRWRVLFTAILVPVLTYGTQVWFTGGNRQKSLIHILDVAQNEACRKVAGVFRTTPTNFISNLLCIPPVTLRWALWLDLSNN